MCLNISSSAATTDNHAFFTDVDRIRYLDDLREITLQEHCVVHAYVLMTNHVHLLMTPTQSGQIGRVMQALGRHYVRYVNDRQARDRVW